MTRPSKTPAKGQTPRRRLCLAEQTHDKTPYLCTRDLDHPGDHTWIPREDMPAKLREALLDGGRVDADDVTTELAATDPVRDPATAQEDGGEWFNGENKAEAQREEQRQDRDDQRRAEIAAAVTPAEIAEMEQIGATHPHVQRGSMAWPDTANGPRPVSVSGAPGSRQADVISRMHALAFEGYPAEVQDEVIWTEIATHALVSMREEQARTKRHADPALIAAVLDAVDHIARARGLVRGTGAGT